MTEPTMVNTTPHTVTLYVCKDIIVDYAADKERQLRLAEQPGEDRGTAHGVPTRGPPQWTGLVPMSWGPSPFSDIDGPIDLLVSMPVGNYLAANGLPPGWRERVHAVYGPDTGPAAVVRDDSGQIRGTRALIRYA